MAETLTASVEHPTPSLPEWLKKGAQRPLAAVLAIAVVALIWSFAPRANDAIVDSAAVEIQTTTKSVELPPEWRYRRADASFEAMYPAER